MLARGSNPAMVVGAGGPNISGNSNVGCPCLALILAIKSPGTLVIGIGCVGCVGAVGCAPVTLTTGCSGGGGASLPAEIGGRGDGRVNSLGTNGVGRLGGGAGLGGSGLLPNPLSYSSRVGID